MCEKTYTWKYPGDPECKHCKGECYYEGMSGMLKCYGRVPMTNADRIRKMSDEKLAEWAMRGLFFPRCPVVRCPTVEDCKDCWLLWLKEEVAEDG